MSDAATPLRHGLAFVSIPGPTVVPERVRSAMARPMPNIYAGEMVDVSDEVLAALPALARTEHHVFATHGNGHAAWQMAICNTLSKGDKVLVLESGRFAVIWGMQAERSGVEVEVLEQTDGLAIDPAALEARLRADTDHEIKAILTVQIDTASSVHNDIPALRAAMDSAGHPALLMVDCIASLGCVPYEMDAWGVDLTVAATQKGLMVPPGMSFVWAGPKALAAYETADLKVGYFDWEPRMDPDGAIYTRYAGTPPITHLYGLKESLALIEEEGGLEAVWNRHRVHAGAVHAAVSAWSEGGEIDFFVPEPAHRAHSVTTVATGGLDAARLREICEDQLRLTLGIGISHLADASFRIGHMGHVNPPMLLGTLGGIEVALAAMGHQCPSGVAAAAAHIAEHLGS